MAIFNKNDDGTVPASETTIIAAGASIKGEFSFDSMLHVDGSIEGNISSKSIIIIGRRGSVKGELKSEKLVINGSFEGNADCTNVEILAGGVFTGNVVSKELMIEGKAKFEGNSSIRKTESSLLKNSSNTTSSGSSVNNSVKNTPDTSLKKEI